MTDSGGLDQLRGDLIISFLPVKYFIRVTTVNPELSNMQSLFGQKPF